MRETGGEWGGSGGSGTLSASPHSSQQGQRDILARAGSQAPAEQTIGSWRRLRRLTGHLRGQKGIDGSARKSSTRGTGTAEAYTPPPKNTTSPAAGRAAGLAGHSRGGGGTGGSQDTPETRGGSDSSRDTHEGKGHHRQRAERLGWLGTRQEKHTPT